MNYYWNVPEEQKSLLQTDKLHIGKDVSQWSFMLRIYPELGISSRSAWDETLEQGSIEDENGNPVTQSNLNTVMDNPDIRCRQPLYNCAKREGTCDLIESDFS